jgi:hypothetical protein
VLAVRVNSHPAAYRGVRYSCQDIPYVRQNALTSVATDHATKIARTLGDYLWHSIDPPSVRRQAVERTLGTGVREYPDLRFKS